MKLPIFSNALPQTKRLPLGEFSERKLLLSVVDICLIVTAIIGSVYYLGNTNDRALPLKYIYDSPWMVLMCVGWLIWLFVSDLYDLRMAVQLRQTIGKIGLGTILTGIVYLCCYALTQPLSIGDEYFSLQFAPGLAIGSIGLLLSIWRAVYTVFLGAEYGTQRVLIFGAGVSGGILATAFENYPHYQAIGFIDDNPKIHGKSHHNLKVLGDRHQLRSAVDLYGINQIMLAVTKPIDDDLLQILTSCHEQGVSITPMPVVYEKLTGKIAIDHIGSQWYSALPFRKHQFETFSRIGKRCIDLVCGLIIGVILAGVFPFVAIAIKLDSPGPIFYKQERVGLHGLPFTVYKFRSMVQNAERNGKAQWSVQGDSRITKVGNFIRKTRLDELPQVLNVLRGDMSMVGPRPERDQFIQKLQQQIPFYRTRLAAKPGLTGWAQVNYGYGSTVADAAIKLQYDLYYLKHWSPWLDFKILLRTFAVVLKMQGQ
jgi:exopolysaccharide biosynthesis polyprenyl glycosylphosphotransferase